MPSHTPAPLRPLLLATGMLTTLRVPMRGEVGGSELAAATALYPLVGLGVGLVPAAALCLPLPALPRAVLALAAWTLATGALHLDGWADSCDAAFAPALADPAATRERRLAILKDPRVGVFGAAGVALLLLAKWAALVYAPTGAPLLAAPVARWVMVHTLHAHPAARPDGLGAALAGRARVWEATGVLVLLLAPLVVTFGDPFRAAGSVVAAALAGWLAAGFLARRFGGVTGDVCGAAGEAAELAALWVFLPWGSA